MFTFGNQAYHDITRKFTQYSEKPHLAVQKVTTVSTIHVVYTKTHSHYLIQQQITNVGQSGVKINVIKVMFEKACKS